MQKNKARGGRSFISADIVKQQRVCRLRFPGLHILFQSTGIVAILKKFIAVVYRSRKKRHRQHA